VDEDVKVTLDNVVDDEVLVTDPLLLVLDTTPWELPVEGSIYISRRLPAPQYS
jgi:hypothetical protein